MMVKTLESEMLKGADAALVKRIEHHRKVIRDGTRTEMGDHGPYTTKTPEATASERRLRPLMELSMDMRTIDPSSLVEPA